MKRFLLFLFLLFWTNTIFGAVPTRSFTYTAGNTIQPSEVTQNEDNIFTYLQQGVETLANNSVTSAKITDSTIVSADILDGTILGADLASNIAITTTGVTTTSGLSVTGSILDQNDNSPVAGDFLGATVGKIDWMPATQYQVGSVSPIASGSVTTTTVSGLNFKPKAIYFLMADNDAAAVRGSWGYDDTNANSNCIYSTNAAGNFTHGSSAIVDYESLGNTLTGNVSAVTNNSFTITWTRTGSPTANLAVKWFAFK